MGSRFHVARLVAFLPAGCATDRMTAPMEKMRRRLSVKVGKSESRIAWSEVWWNVTWWYWGYLFCFQIPWNHAVATSNSLAHLESAFPPAGSATATSTARIAATRRLPSALLIPLVFLVKLSRASSFVRMDFSVWTQHRSIIVSPSFDFLIIQRVMYLFLWYLTKNLRSVTQPPNAKTNRTKAVSAWPQAATPWNATRWCEPSNNCN